MNNEGHDKPTNHALDLKRVLVVISPDLVKPGAPKESALVSRAIALAKATGCELEFFHVCHDDALTTGFFSDDDNVRREQAKRVDEDASLMAELVLRLRAEGVKISHDTQWDSPRTDAILRKISVSQPDLVMKQSRENRYVMGLLSNTDWDLIRQSPAHVWFVTEDGVDKIDSVVTAVGANTNEDEIISGADYDVFRMANLVAESFDATNTPVHAYQAPVGLRTYAAYAPEFGGVAMPPPRDIPTAEEARQRIAKKHGRSIEAFAEYFLVEPSRIQVVEGNPSDVLAAVASQVKANLIVMAARNLSRWERWRQSVSAEPLLADAPCDVLFVKDARDASNPAAQVRALKGVPAYDLEKAIMDPGLTFGSPASLAQADGISVSLRNRIFEIWKQDIKAQMAEEDEGGPVRVTHADLLKSLNSAQTLLRQQSDEALEATAVLNH